MSTKEVAYTVIAAGWLFFELRDLLRHGWRNRLALRLVVGLTMLAAAITGFVLVLQDQLVPGLVFFAVALLIGEVGGRALQSPGQPIKGDPREKTVKTILLTAALVLAATDLFD